MNIRLDQRLLEADTSVARVIWTTDQIRDIAFDALRRNEKSVMESLLEIERADDAERDNRSIIGCVLAPIATSLAAHGMPIPYTYGAVRDALGFCDLAMHWAFCSCGHGPRMYCGEAAEMLRALRECEASGMLKLMIENAHR